MTKSKKLRGERKQDKILFVVDDASGINEKLYDVTKNCPKYTLYIGSPWPIKNFFDKRARSDD